MAVDNLEDAVTCASANAERNGVSASVQCVHRDALDLTQAALVVANLLAPVHVEIGGRYARLLRPGATSCPAAFRNRKAKR